MNTPKFWKENPPSHIEKAIWKPHKSGRGVEWLMQTPETSGGSDEATPIESVLAEIIERASRAQAAADSAERDADDLKKKATEGSAYSGADPTHEAGPGASEKALKLQREIWGMLDSLERYEPPRKTVLMHETRWLNQIAKAHTAHEIDDEEAEILRHDAQSLRRAFNARMMATDPDNVTAWTLPEPGHSFAQRQQEAADARRAANRAKSETYEFRTKWAEAPTRFESNDGQTMPKSLIGLAILNEIASLKESGGSIEPLRKLISAQARKLAAANMKQKEFALWSAWAMKGTAIDVYTPKPRRPRASKYHPRPF